MTSIQHPWQSGPTELLSHALTHMHRQTDFDHRIAFLLIDVGVETLFKTFLTAPEKETSALGKFHDRKEAAEGNFHDLIIGVERAAGSRLTGFNLSHVHYYHDTRNKLYHDGVGITVPSSETQAYAKLAVDLLQALLDVDLSAELNKPAIESAEQTKQDKQQQELEQQVQAIKESRARVEHVAVAAVEKIDPQLALPSFQKRFKEYWDEALNERQSSLFHDSRPKSFKEALSASATFILNDPNLKAAEKLVAAEADKIKFPYNKEDLVDVVAASDGDLIQFYLLLLSGKIFGETRSDWIGEYEVSGFYPNGDRELLSERVYDDSYENIVDVYEPDNSVIIASGREHVSQLNRICDAIKSWVEKT